MAITPYDVTNKIDLLIQANNQAFGSITGTSITLGSTVLDGNILRENNYALSTGLYEFGSLGVTMNTGNTFNVGNVKGFIVDAQDPTNVTTTFVSFSGATGLTTPFLSASTGTHILLNSGGTLTYLATEPTSLQRRQNIYLGTLGHTNTTLNGSASRPDVGVNALAQVRDMFQPIKFINNGVILFPNSTDLSLGNTAGQFFSLGVGFVLSGSARPSSFDVPVGSPRTFQYRTLTGGTSPNTTLINPLLSDVGGVATVIAGSSNQATNQRAYLIQNGNIRIQYGQTIYSTLAEAVAGASNEAYTTNQNNKDFGVLIGIICVTKGCINLSDTATAKFLPVSKFGESVGAAAGISVSTLQSSYNNSSVDPEIITNSTLNGIAIRRGSASDTDNLLVGQNGAGTTTFGFNGNGVVNGTTFIATNGTVRLKNYTVATLPAGVQGDTAFVTDGLAPSFLTTIVGGGAIVTPVFYNGTTWVSH